MIQATIKRGEFDPNTVAVYIKVVGASPFKKGKKNFIATAQIPLAFTKGQDVAKPVIESPLFTAYIDDLMHCSNGKDDYFSVNLVPGASVNEMVLGKTTLVFTAYFENGIPAGLKILNCVSAYLNQQCQFSAQDNHGKEYTEPFKNPGKLFYGTKGESRIGHAGTGNGGDLAGITYDGSTPVLSTFMSWVKVI